MRTIKFRIWNNKTKSWIHGPNKRSELDGINLFGETVILGEILHGVSIEDLHDIVALQFTGILDKNGREIFEGDIVKFRYEMYESDWEEGQGEVYFEDGIFFFGKAFYQFATNDSNFDKKSLEIIGNIYENPELLKP